jgi:UDP-GlcNAc:undecaprenyl-phosphate GlcNAc-1-phosphate transferase
MILLCLCALTVLSWAIGLPFVTAAALSVAGAVLGFLRFNTHPARVFMGDAGSQLLGFSVAFLSIVLTQDVSSPLATALPLLLLGIPIIDTAAVMIERLMAGHSPFKADRNHLHHRLLALGFDHVEAVTLIYFAQALLFVEAWYLRYESDLQIVLLFAIQAVLIIALPRWAQRAGWRRRPVSAEDAQPATTALRAGIRWLRAPSRLPAWTQWATALSLAGYVLLVAVAGARADRDTCLLAGVVFLAVGAAQAFGSRPIILWCAKAALYVSAALLVYLDDPSTVPHTWRVAEFIALGTMVMSVVLWIRLSSRRRFELTPLDLLVVLVAVIAPNLAAAAPDSRSWGLAAVKLIALFYAIEALGAGDVLRGRWLNWSVLSVMGILLARGL